MHLLDGFMIDTLRLKYHFYTSSEKTDILQVGVLAYTIINDRNYRGSTAPDFNRVLQFRQPGRQIPEDHKLMKETLTEHLFTSTILSFFYETY